MCMDDTRYIWFSLWAKLSVIWWGELWSVCKYYHKNGTNWRSCCTIFLANWIHSIRPERVSLIIYIWSEYYMCHWKYSVRFERMKKKYSKILSLFCFVVWLFKKIQEAILLECLLSLVSSKSWMYYLIKFLSLYQSISLYFFLLAEFFNIIINKNEINVLFYLLSWVVLSIVF